MTAGSSAIAAGPTTLLSGMTDSAEVVELERRVFSSVGRLAEMASVMAEVVGDDEASKLVWVVGRRTR